MTNSDGRLKILLSEGSSNSARQTLYGLGRRYITDIVDPTPWCQCRFSRFVRRRYRCPPIGQDPIGYLKSVSDLVRRQRYDVFFATHEQVYLISKYRDVLQPHVGLAVPEFESLFQMQGKGDFARLLERLDLPGPETEIVRSERELRSRLRFPRFIKLAHSTASYGVRYVESDDDLETAIGQFKSDGLWEEGSEILIQEAATGVQSSINCVFQNGRLIAAHCTETVTTGIGGGSDVRISASHPVAVEHTRRLGQHLNWHGPLLLEYFYNHATGQPQFIEANPRIGETVNALVCGINLVELVVQISLGQRVEPVPLGKVGVKSHAGFIVLLADAHNGASRRALLRRIWQMWTHQGDFAAENEMTRAREDWGSLIPAAAATLRLLAFPRSARRLSRNTVDHYSLPQSAVSEIQRSPVDAIANRL